MSSNLILNIPHSSTRLTGMNPFPRFTNWATGAAFMQMLHNELLPMTDWYTDELFINGIGKPIIATISRVICDTERFRNDEDEPMSKIGISAFDYKQFRNKNVGQQNRLLFVAHREEILAQSRDCFRGVLKDPNFGDLLVGNNKPSQLSHPIPARFIKKLSRGIAL